MSFNIDTCRWVFYGAMLNRNYNTFGHIHDAFIKALKHLKKETLWVNHEDVDQHQYTDNDLFCAMDCDIYKLPRIQGAFYFVHNALGSPAEAYLKGYRMLSYGVHISTNHYDARVEEIGPEIYFDRVTPALSFRWGTDLLPEEIMWNPPNRVWNPESKVINYIGTVDDSNRDSIVAFTKAAAEKGIMFQHYGGYGRRNPTIVSIQDNVDLVRESFMAPTIQRQSQVDTGYIPCRIFKNISYGQYGITNSKYVNELFQNRLIYNADTYQLFYDALDQLPKIQPSQLHELMRLIADKYTYLNKVKGVMDAIRTLQA